jgi:hypothetical protein
MRTYSHPGTFMPICSNVLPDFAIGIYQRLAHNSFA